MDVETKLRELKEGLEKIGKLDVHPHCSVDGCDDLCDVTKMGVDSSCPYHRLLFDHWMYKIAMNQFPHVMKDRKQRRQMFGDWMDKMGREACDGIVVDMAKDNVNWMC